MGDAGSRADVRSVPQADRRDQRAVGADEDPVADGGGVLARAVVVAGDDSGADIDARSDDRIAQVCEVVGLGAAAQRGLLGLAEVADVGHLADPALRPQVGVGAEDRAVADLRTVQNASVAHDDAVAQDGVLHHRVGADAALRADARCAQKLDVRFNHRVRADGDLVVDDACIWAEDGDSLGHQAARGGGAHGLVEVHHLGDGVGAQHLVHAAGLERDDALAVGHQQRGDVRQIELAVGVVGGEQVELAEERRSLEAVDSGVDLRRGELGGRERLLFDDGEHLGLARGEAQDASIASGVLGDRGEDGHRRALFQVQLAERGERFGADQRNVARENEEMVRKRRAGELQPGLEHLHGVAGSALVWLRDKRDTRAGDRGLHAPGLVADDAVYLSVADQRLCRCNDVQQQGSSADLVQHLGPLAVEPRALARGHDGYCKTCRFHVSAIFSLLAAHRHEFIARAGGSSQFGTGGRQRVGSGVSSRILMACW